MQLRVLQLEHSFILLVVVGFVREWSDGSGYDAWLHEALDHSVMLLPH